MDSTTEKDKIREGFKIRITFNIYCYYCDSMTSTDKKETINLPLLKEFRNKHIDNYGYVINVDDWPLSFYRKDENDSTYCKKISYQIIKAKVIKDKRKIDLGD